VSGKNEWHSLCFLEKQPFVMRLALARVREILTFAQTMYQLAAQEEQGLQLRAPQSALAAEMRLAHTGGLTLPWYRGNRGIWERPLRES
jgi:hypothetical protein